MENQTENKMEHDMETGGVYRRYLWSVGNEGMENNMETTLMGYIERKVCVRDVQFTPPPFPGSFRRSSLEFGGLRAE